SHACGPFAALLSVHQCASRTRTLPLPRPTLFPYTTLFRSQGSSPASTAPVRDRVGRGRLPRSRRRGRGLWRISRRSGAAHIARLDRKSTRLNSSHVSISYAVLCLKKKREAPADGTHSGGHL